MTTPKIHSLLARDPRSGRLANNGQARITETLDERARAELRAELESFVCDGRFGDALERILDRFLGGLGSPRQEAAWVSGFFGSGKSHLLKMLGHLWVNTRFDDGATARSLVPGGLPEAIQDQLKELDTQARRTGKPALAAAGTLLGGNLDHVRRTVLAILLRACGLPSQYAQARFCFWLEEEGLLEAVRGAVEGAGRDWLRELDDLYVSPVIARALVEHAAGFAADEGGARQVLIRQFQQPETDISSEEFIASGRRALGGGGELPLTVVVLDEVEQYISEATERASILTEVAEALQTQFDSRVMLVGAGQSALASGRSTLMWLKDRFRITVQLTDADVEAVTRKVLLQKKPSAVPRIEELFDRHAGEVARQLQGTRLGPRSEDARDRTPDYPLLPTRRRFWEACFQAADAAGTHSQLRSQLRILHDSLHAVAERPLGAVIPASDLFHALAPSLVNTGVLLNEIDTRIQRLDDGSDDGPLARDLCGLAFLIPKLPRGQDLDLGMRADPATLADLLVDDITADSGPFRKRVAELVETLARDGVLMRVGEEVRLQTTEGAEWDRALRERRSALEGNEVEVASRRDQLFGAAVQEVLAGIRLTHGEAKLRRPIALHAGNEPPPADGHQLVVWLRDGWSVPRGEVEAAARRLGQEDPTLHVYLERRSEEELRGRIVEAEAARQVLDHRGTPASPEGIEARESIESRLRIAEAGRDGILRDLLRAAKVYHSGGTEVFGEGLAEKLQGAAEASLARLFPRFHEGDHRGWEAALKRAREGSDQPLRVVGWEGASEDHPVAKEALARVAVGIRGSELQRALEAPPFGWPRDAVDAAVVALHGSGHLRAVRNGQPVPVGALDQSVIKSAELRSERVRLTTGQRIELRGLFGSLGVNTKSGEEELRAPAFLDALAALASRAGGAPPLPSPPEIRRLEELQRLTGSDQLGAILEAKEELEEAIRAWGELARRRDARAPAWELAQALQRHAADAALPVAEEVGAELEALTRERLLLDPTDHLAPLLDKLTGALRSELTRRREALARAVEQGQAALAADATWAALDPEAREALRRAAGLEAPPPADAATPAALREALQARPLPAWSDQLDALPQRLARALAEAAAHIDAAGSGEPVATVQVRRGTLLDEPAIRAWLEEHEHKLLDAHRSRKGPVIVT